MQRNHFQDAIFLLLYDTRKNVQLMQKLQQALTQTQQN
jgi:hypothetical protein